MQDLNLLSINNASLFNVWYNIVPSVHYIVKISAFFVTMAMPSLKTYPANFLLVKLTTVLNVFQQMVIHASNAKLATNCH